MSQYSLSVIIPTYKRPEVLTVNLQSIIDAKVPCTEVIVGDDGGDEPTISVIKAFATQLNIRRLPPDGKGSLSGNITRLIHAVQTEWILFIHDDDFLTGDHSHYLDNYINDYDFVFSDHWICHSNGRIDESLTQQNSKQYKRIWLSSGLQNDVFSLLIDQSICLDGFYVRACHLKKSLPNAQFGQVADYFWVFNMLSHNVRIAYSMDKTFVYRLSSDGLTAQGGHLNEDSVKGYRHLLSIEEDKNKQKILENQIYFNTWFAVNACIRRGDKKRLGSY